MSPVVGNVYYDDIPIVCAIDKNIVSVSWFSSVEGNLGTGAQISSRLSSGNHVITARDVQGNLSVSVSITVTERNSVEKNGTRFLIPHLPYTCTVKNNRFKPYIASLDGSASDLIITTKLLPKPKPRYSNKSEKNITAEINNLSNSADAIKLFRCTGAADMQKFPIVSHPQIFSRNTAPALRDENERNFYIVNTALQSAQPHCLPFKRYYNSDIIAAWIPKEYAADTAAIDACIAEFENTRYAFFTHA